jgi:hypothetical protein
MDSDLKKRWVEALRSGKYKQGRHDLRFRDAFCCLGVLLDLNDPEGWLGFGQHRLGNGEEAYIKHPGKFGVAGPTQRKLARMNDSGKSFSEIADYIEANL